MAQLVILENRHAFVTECIGCAERLAVDAGWQIFAGDVEHAICDRCALKVDATITRQRDERYRTSPREGGTDK